MCASRDRIYIPTSRHTIRLLESLNSGGILKGISNEENNQPDFDSSKALESNEKPIIDSEENANMLLSFNGDYTIENVIIDCRQVRIGIWIKEGTVILKNCCLIGDRKSSTGIGIVIAGNFSVYMFIFFTECICHATWYFLHKCIYTRAVQPVTQGLEVASSQFESGPENM